MKDNPPALGVASSLKQQQWQLRPALDRHVAAIAQQQDVPDALARLLAGRGLDPENAAAFLKPQLKTSLPDPMALKDMDRAVGRVQAALDRNEKICLFGDYDVDGATSSAALYRYLSSLGADCTICIPDRIEEGYGPNPDAMRRFKQQGFALVLTLDCGIAAFDALEEADQLGLDVMVLDHHKAPAILPPGVALVNPNRLDDDPRSAGMMAAVGIVFLFVIALRSARRAAGQDIGLDPLALLDLVALGTVCDMVPLTGPNRTLVAQGLKVMARRGNLGLTQLADVAGADGPPSPYHLGFLLGPRINAGGRLGDAGLGARLLTLQDGDEAARIAATLDRLNEERRAVEQLVLEEAMAQAALMPEGPIALVHARGWHPGVVGIVAGRLKDALGKPSLVLAQEGDKAVGSGRSIPGVDLGAAIIDAKAQGLLIKGGGHAMAAGLTVEAHKIEPVREFLSQRLSQQVADARAGATLMLDGVLSIGGCTQDLVAQLDRAGPFGMGNPSPRFAIGSAIIDFAKVVGQGHVKMRLKDDGGSGLDAIGFRMADSELGQLLLQGRPAGRVHVAGRLGINRYQGRGTVQLQLDDAAPAP